MRLMWLWVFLYATGIGLMLFFLAFAIWWGLDMNPPIGIAYDIGQIAAKVGFFAPMGGFLALIAGMVFLLIRRTVAAGRVVTLIGLGFYYVAALGVVVAGTMSELSPSREFSAGGTAFIVFLVAVPVGLPAFFMTRTLRRAIKAEKGET